MVSRNKQYGTKPKEGFVYNPIFKYPRNLKCFCGTDKKFKKCCLRLMPKVVSKEKAEEMKKALIMAGIK